VGVEGRHVSWSPTAVWVAHRVGLPPDSQDGCAVVRAGTSLLCHGHALHRWHVDSRQRMRVGRDDGMVTGWGGGKDQGRDRLY
jgi:hypothetical protein